MNCYRVSFVLIGFVLASACDRLPTFDEPLQDVDRLSEVELAQEVPPPQMLATDTPQNSPFSGLWDRLGGVGPATDVDENPIDLDPLSSEVQDVSGETELPLQAVELAAPSRPDQRTGFLSGGVFDFLRPAPAGDTGFAEEPSNILARFTTPVAGAAAEPEARDVAPMSELAFGSLERTCGLSRRELGREVANASGFKVYDTDPGSTVMRPHYIIGFDDGCARQFSAALVLLGDVGTHEIVRYSRTGVALAYSATDDAYEAIKTDFCRVGEGKPCGARLEALGKVATFVTAYRSFGAAPEWAEFLLYDGQVAAVDLESL